MLGTRLALFRDDAGRPRALLDLLPRHGEAEQTRHPAALSGTP